jgi:hypothetical protein
MGVPIRFHCGKLNDVTPRFISYICSFQAGTTLLMALPLGAFLCFFNLLGARAFSRGELAIQFYFHKPLSYPPPFPPRPIFTRYRERDLTPAELEQGVMTRPRTLVRETSFYKNTYAMVSLISSNFSTPNYLFSSSRIQRRIKPYSTSLSSNLPSLSFFQYHYGFSFRCSLR